MNKSHLFSVYNRLKWEAKRSGNEKMVQRLNKALGICQSKNYYAQPDRDYYIPTRQSCGCYDWIFRYRVARAYTGACKHMLACTLEYLVRNYAQTHTLPVQTGGVFVLSPPISSPQSKGV